MLVAVALYAEPPAATADKPAVSTSGKSAETTKADEALRREIAAAWKKRSRHHEYAAFAYTGSQWRSNDSFDSRWTVKAPVKDDPLHNAGHQTVNYKLVWAGPERFWWERRGPVPNVSDRKWETVTNIESIDGKLRQSLHVDEGTYLTVKAQGSLHNSKGAFGSSSPLWWAFRNEHRGEGALPDPLTAQLNAKATDLDGKLSVSLTADNQTYFLDPTHGYRIYQVSRYRSQEKNMPRQLFSRTDLEYATVDGHADVPIRWRVRRYSNDKPQALKSDAYVTLNRFALSKEAGVAPEFEFPEETLVYDMRGRKQKAYIQRGGKLQPFKLDAPW